MTKIGNYLQMGLDQEQRARDEHMKRERELQQQLEEKREEVQVQRRKLEYLKERDTKYQKLGITLSFNWQYLENGTWKDFNEKVNQRLNEMEMDPNGFKTKSIEGAPGGNMTVCRVSADDGWAILNGQLTQYQIRRLVTG